jgi:hypothetical protein
VGDKDFCYATNSFLSLLNGFDRSWPFNGVFVAFDFKHLPSLFREKKAFLSNQIQSPFRFHLGTYTPSPITCSLLTESLSESAH